MRSDGSLWLPQRRNRSQNPAAAQGTGDSSSRGTGQLMKTVLYGRVSSDSQEEKGSIRTQLETAAGYCKLQRITITERYLDDGVSGSIPLKERPAGSRLIADVEAGKVD